MREMTSNQILSQLSELPVTAVVPAIQVSLAEGRDVLLQAEPGAGKDHGSSAHFVGRIWLDARRIIMLEPRRIAARSAAERMASLLGERAGKPLATVCASTPGSVIRRKSRSSQKVFLHEWCNPILRYRMLRW